MNNADFIVSQQSYSEVLEYLVPADSTLAELIRLSIANDSLEKRVLVSSLGNGELGRTIRYNEHTEGVLESVQHEAKVSHITVGGLALTSTEYNETVIILPL